MSRNCPTDASRYIVAIHFWLLPVASSRFYFAGACPRSKDIFPLNFLVTGNSLGRLNRLKELKPRKWPYFETLLQILLAWQLRISSS